MRRAGWRGLLGLGLILAAPLAFAHASSSSYLQLRLDDGQLSGRLDIALRDLDMALGLDGDGDGALRWGEVRGATPRISTYALSRLQLRAGTGACTLQAGELRIAEHADGSYAALALQGRCPASAEPLTLDYRLLFDLDRQHRGLLALQAGAQTYSAVFGPQSGPLSFGGPATAALWPLLRSYFNEGLWHVWTGLDHVLFLAALFLPAVLWRTRSGWSVTPTLRSALLQTCGVVTAFTLAHAATLSLAALGWVHWPTRWVESAVAATVLFAGLNNLWPMLRRRLAGVAALFGLIHGSAMAGALLELGLPIGGRLPALAAFNLGVEAAQLLLIAGVVPLSYALRHSTRYRRYVLLPGSALIALIGFAWLVQRAFALG